MASVFKRTRDRQRKGASWYIAFVDEHGRRRMVKGCPDKSATESLARELETDVELRRRGILDCKTEALRDHAARPLADHLADWHAALLAEGATAKHAPLALERVRRVVAL